MADLHIAVSDIADALFAKRNKEDEGDLEKMEDSSAMRLLLKAEGAQNSVYLTREEVLDQMKILLVAGYETTAGKNPDIQRKLREELLSFDAESKYDQPSKGHPYLEAVVDEILRLYPAVPEIQRQLSEDDIITLSQPMVLSVLV
ncbi:hypothetical protein ID866_13203, partial [Astraeus odoratus]